VCLDGDLTEYLFDVGKFAHEGTTTHASRSLRM
jgi:hypothetical protein